MGLSIKAVMKTFLSITELKLILTVDFLNVFGEIGCRDLSKGISFSLLYSHYSFRPQTVLSEERCSLWVIELSTTLWQPKLSSFRWQMNAWIRRMNFSNVVSWSGWRSHVLSPRLLHLPSSKSHSFLSLHSSSLPMYHLLRSQDELSKSRADALIRTVVGFLHTRIKSDLLSMPWGSPETFLL